MTLQQLEIEKNRYKELFLQNKKKLIDTQNLCTRIEQQITSIEEDTKQKLLQFKTKEEKQRGATIPLETTEADRLEEELKIIRMQTDSYVRRIDQKKANYEKGRNMASKAFIDKIDELNTIQKAVKKSLKRSVSCPKLEYTEEEKKEETPEIEEEIEVEPEPEEVEQKPEEDDKVTVVRDAFEITRKPPHSLLMFSTRQLLEKIKYEMADGNEYIKSKEHYDGVGIIPLDCPWYVCYFSKRVQFHYYCITPNSPIVLSLTCISDQQAPPGRKGGVMALFRSKQVEMKKIIPFGLLGKTEGELNKDHMKSIIPTVLQCMEFNPKMQMKPLKKDNLDAELRSYETSQGGIDYKFGLLFCKDGQKSEGEMYNNSGDDVSEGYIEFMELIGDIIELEGHRGFRAGLDVKSNTTGKRSLYTMFYSSEIMFHVGTMLPHVVADDQKTEKKRHIGNDFCVVIYKEGNDVIDLSSFRSHFNSIFVIVKKIPTELVPDGSDQYMIETWRARDIPEFEPYLPAPGFFIGKEFIREYLLSTCINGQISSYGGAEMKPKMGQARDVCLRKIVDFKEKK